MCLFPIKAEINDLGSITFTTEGNLKLPCGKCNECISKRSIEWATRARHEISLHNQNCFLTLTYDEKNLPDIFIVKDEFQKFMKRLRKHTKQNIRYMVSHEYGSKTFRPHHHAIIFGYNPQNQKLLKTTQSGEKIFTSNEIEKLWDKGFHSIGTANEKTAYYVASYALKGKKHELTNPRNGEIVSVSDCMDASKRPAIGYNFFIENYQQIINAGGVIPRYYLKKLKELHPILFEEYENENSFKLKNRSSHEIYAKHIIDQQKISLKSELRELEPNQEIYTKAFGEILLKQRDEYQFAQNKEKYQ